MGQEREDYNAPTGLRQLPRILKWPIGVQTSPLNVLPCADDQTTSEARIRGRQVRVASRPIAGPLPLQTDITARSLHAESCGLEPKAASVQVE